PGRATVIITHDRAFADRVADHRLVLDGPESGRPRAAAGRTAPPVPAGLDAAPGEAGAAGSTAAPGAADPAVRPEAAASAAGPGESGGLLSLRGAAVDTPRGEPLLAGVDMAVEPGESVALLGPSGSGKSTLLRTAAGLHRLAGGSMSFAGAPLPDRAGDRDRRLLRAIQFVGQDPVGALNPAHRVRTALARPGRVLLGLSREQAEESVPALLEQVGLDRRLADALPGRLSGGQRQRVAIARALAARPALLLADEVTSALDAATAHAVLDLLDSLRGGHGLAVLMATHDTGAADRADRVLTLDLRRRTLLAGQGASG